MTATTILKLAFAGMVFLSLTGCVAAAIPLVAGGALARSQTDGIKAQENKPGQELVAVKPAAEPPGSLSPADADTRTGSGTVSLAAEAPPPTGSKGVTGAQGSHWEFVPLFGYTRSRLQGFSGQTNQISALLANPAALSSDREACPGSTPVLLIDLDPAGGLFDAERIVQPSPWVTNALESFRDEGGFVAWISGNSALAAGDIRVALKTTGFDPTGKDELLLMRYPGERKQTRRKDLAASSCLIAIAGDERADFDELFDYLSKPEVALGLDLLIGDGWFLVPSFTSPTPPSDAAQP